jgi:hypothetical protein
MADVFLTVGKRRTDGAIQISIEKDGIGYRIAGPKFDGDGYNLLRHKLTKRDGEEIRAFLRKVRRGGQ